eukprot:1147496-Pelagomonas_calceolata.AAC.7
MKEKDRSKHDTKVSTAVSHFLHSTMSNLTYSLRNQLVGSHKTREELAPGDDSVGKRLHFPFSSHGKGSVQIWDGACVELEQQRGDKQQQPQQPQQQQEGVTKLANTDVEATSSNTQITGASPAPSTATTTRLSAIAPRVASVSVDGWVAAVRCVLTCPRLQARNHCCMSRQSTSCQAC